ncbi:matrixin family metalloprotease [Brachybacterium paraconglomeratum]|uniref:matrixin family metalloprotease n=1 Tax=Brachybacterium paraconglomeratum TaxID=173362 RepID=UPI003A4D1E8E
MHSVSGSTFVVTSKAMGNNGLDGRETWSYNSTKIITKAEASLNTTNADKVATNEKRLRSIYSHEVGHVLGLSHASQNTSIMYTCPACVYLQHGYYTPRPDDIAGVDSIY